MSLDHAALEAQIEETVEILHLTGDANLLRYERASVEALMLAAYKAQLRRALDTRYPDTAAPKKPLVEDVDPLVPKSDDPPPVAPLHPTVLPEQQAFNYKALERRQDKRELKATVQALSTTDKIILRTTLNKWWADLSSDPNSVDAQEARKAVTATEEVLSDCVGPPPPEGRISDDPWLSEGQIKMQEFLNNLDPVVRETLEASSRVIKAAFDKHVEATESKMGKVLKMLQDLQGRVLLLSQDADPDAKEEVVEIQEGRPGDPKSRIAEKVGKVLGRPVVDGEGKPVLRTIWGCRFELGATVILEFPGTCEEALKKFEQWKHSMRLWVDKSTPNTPKRVGDLADFEIAMEDGPPDVVCIDTDGDEIEPASDERYFISEATAAGDEFILCVTVSPGELVELYCADKYTEVARAKDRDGIVEEARRRNIPEDRVEWL